MTYAAPAPALLGEHSAFSGCALTPTPEAAKRARSFTRQALSSWGLADLTDDAEVVVSELLANAVRHAMCGGTTAAAPDGGPGLGLWLLKHHDGLMCVVTDPSDTTPALRYSDSTAENGRGLQVIHSLSDHWGWSPLAGRGKAVWAILFRS